MKKRVFRKRKLILGIVLCILITVAVVYLPGIISSCSGEFSSQNWAKYPCLRCHMIEDMEQEIDLYNLSRESIKSFLGEPDVNEGERFISYYIESGGMNHMTYTIHFDGMGKVFKAFSHIGDNYWDY